MSINPINRMNTRNARETNPYSLQSVVLGPVVDDIEEDASKEPCFVRVRQQNSAVMHVDNESYDLAANTGNPSLFSLKLREGSNLFQRTKRLRVNQIRLMYSAPNINVRNNNIIFATAAAPLTSYSVTIPEGYYTVATARTALLAALNGAGSGIVWTLVDNFVGSTLYTVLTASAPFILRQCSWMERPFFWGIPIYNAENNPYYDVTLSSIQMGPITAKYTDYVDFVSREMYQFSKMNTSGTQQYSDVLGRVYLDNDGMNTRTCPDSWINYDKDSTLASMNVLLLDMYESPLYVPTSTCPMYFNIEVVKQL